MALGVHQGRDSRAKGFLRSIECAPLSFLFHLYEIRKNQVLGTLNAGPRVENQMADALATLAAMSKKDVVNKE